MPAIVRRDFLTDAVGGAVTLGALHTLSAAQEREPVNVAVIGVMGMGHFHVRTLVARDDARITHLCDVDQSVLDKAAKTVEDAKRKPPKLVSDFRRVLDDKTVEAVVIATPNHWHCPIALRAMQAGKDVYIEKPASHVFREGQVLIESAQKNKRIVQHGTQMRSSAVTAKAAEIIASGLLGEIKMAKAWNSQQQNKPQPKKDAPVPAGVDYEMWLGPAPKRPFNPNRYNRTWRCYRDYGNGDIGDDGIHDLDMARWALKETTHPVRITAHGSRVDLDGDFEFPDNMTVAYEYADKKVLLYEDRQWTPYGVHGVDSGNEFYGTKGHMIFSRRGFFRVFLASKDGKGMEEPGPEMGTPGRVSQPAPEHMANFLSCVRSRKEPNAPVADAHLSSALVHLGEIASRLGRVLQFDPKQEAFVKDAQADALLTKEYREPWKLSE